MLHELLNFEPAASVADWSAVDDRVMGGVSLSRLRHEGAGAAGDAGIRGFAVFEGCVSLAHGGGFASVRLAPGTRPLGVPAVAAYVLRLLGDGHRYKLNLRTDAAFDGVNYQAAFTPPAGTWASLRLPLEAFEPSFRGRAVPGAPPLDSARVLQVGLMIADRQAGSFSLCVRSLHAETSRAGLRLVKT
jgi:hypothetical protein